MNYLEMNCFTTNTMTTDSTNFSLGLAENSIRKGVLVVAEVLTWVVEGALVPFSSYSLDAHQMVADFDSDTFLHIV